MNAGSVTRCFIGLLVPLYLLRCGEDSPSNDERTCNELAATANQRRIDLQATAERSCLTDQDCTVIDYRVACWSDCASEPAAVARTSEPALTSDVKRVTDEICGDFSERGCVRLPDPCVPGGNTPTATCDGGVCTLGFVRVD